MQRAEAACLRSGGRLPLRAKLWYNSRQKGNRALRDEKKRLTDGGKRRMTKWTRILLAVYLLVFVYHLNCAAAEYAYQLKSPSASDISLSDAANLALQHILEEGNGISLSEDGYNYDFHLIELENTPIYCKGTFASFEQQDVWIISFFPEDVPILASAVTVASPSGAIIDSTTGFTVTMQNKWEEEKGPYPFWSVEDKAMFDALYANPAQRERHVLPCAEDLSLDRAVQIACEAVAETYALSLAGISADFLLDCNLIESGNEDGVSRQWQIDFRKKRVAADAYDLFYWVYIDAATGDVVAVEENTGGFG